MMCFSYFVSTSLCLGIQLVLVSHTQVLPVCLQAIAAAQAIAARLSAQAVGTAAAPIATPSNTWAGQPDYYQPSPADAIAAAQAVAARLAAVAPPDFPATHAAPQQQDWYQEAAPLASSVDAATAAAQAIADKLAAQYAGPQPPVQQSHAVHAAANEAAPAVSAAAAAAQAIAARLAAQAGMPLGQPGYDPPAGVDRSQQRKKWDAQ